ALELLQREARAHARADRHVRGEAHAVQALIDAYAAVAEGEGRFRQMREQRQRQKAMGDRAAELGIFRPLAIDVDPLVVVDRLGERVDTLLGDLHPRRDADFFADAALELTNRRHFCAAKPCFSRSTSASVAAERRGAPAGSSRSSSARSASYACICLRSFSSALRKFCGGALAS